MNKIINSTNLTKVYGEKETSVTALDSINIEFKENEFTAIMGPSGMRAIAMMLNWPQFVMRCRLDFLQETLVHS